MEPAESAANTRCYALRLGRPAPRVAVLGRPQHLTLSTPLARAEAQTLATPRRRVRRSGDGSCATALDVALRQGSDPAEARRCSSSSPSVPDHLGTVAYIAITDMHDQTQLAQRIDRPGLRSLRAQQDNAQRHLRRTPCTSRVRRPTPGRQSRVHGGPHGELVRAHGDRVRIAFANAGAARVVAVHAVVGERARARLRPRTTSPGSRGELDRRRRAALHAPTGVEPLPPAAVTDRPCAAA